MTLLRKTLCLSLIIGGCFVSYSMEQTQQVLSLKDICIEFIVKNLLEQDQDKNQNLAQIHELPVELRELIHQRLYNVIPKDHNKVNLEFVRKIVGNDTVSTIVVPDQPCNLSHASPHNVPYPDCDGKCKGYTEKSAYIIKSANLSNDDYLATLSYLMNKKSNSWIKKEDKPTINIWDIKMANCVKQIAIADDSIVYFDDKRVVTRKGQTVTITNFDEPERKIGLTLDIDKYIRCESAEIFPDSIRLALAFDQKLYVLNMLDLSIEPITTHCRNIEAITVCPDNTHILFADSKSLFYFFDSINCLCSKKIKLPKPHRSRSYITCGPYGDPTPVRSGLSINKILFSPHLNVILIEAKSALLLYDIAQDKILWKISSPSSITHASFNFDASCILGLCSSNSLYVWETLTGKVLSVHPIDDLNLKEFGNNACMKYNPKNNQLILADDRDTTYLYDLKFVKDASLEELVSFVRSIVAKADTISLSKN